MDIIRVDENESMNLRESKEGYMGQCERRKGKREMIEL